MYFQLARIRSLRFLILILGLVVIASSGLAAPGDENWDNTFGLPGADGEVRATTVFQGDLIIGGNFIAVGGSSLTNLARWDGVQWVAMGQPFNDYVNSLIVWNAELYVGGDFTMSGATPISGFARWDGTNWVEAGGGVDGGYVQDLAIWDSRLVVSGEFGSLGGDVAFSENVAIWDGTNWEELDGGVGGIVADAIDYGGDLYVCGEFDFAGGASVANLARWDGLSWSTVGGGLRDEFDDIYNAFPSNMVLHGGLLVIGGHFQKAGPIVVDGITAWNGSSFSSYSGTSFNGEVDFVGVYAGDLLALGGLGSLMAWNGFFWNQLGYVAGSISSTSEYTGGLIVAGGFVAVDGISCRSLALYNGSWSAVVAGEGANSTVEVFHDWNGTLVVGGRFSRIGAVGNQVVAAWDGTAWTPLGSGINSGFGPFVSALATFEGDLIVGGAFTSAGGVAAEKIARWDGVQWSAMGSGSQAGVQGLLALGSNLYATGQWNGTNTLGQWDGAEFQPLGSSVLGGAQQLSGLGVYQNQLVMVGSFTSVDGVPAANIARWDGTNWQSLGAGTSGSVNNVCEDNGLLYVGGSFIEAGGVPAVSIAVWDGTNWSALGGGLNGRVTDVAAYGGAIYATGIFTQADGQPTPYVARWDGVSWQGLGSGLDAEGSALGVFNNELYVGGDFSIAGTTGSSRIARWSVAASAVDPSPAGPTRLFLSAAYPNPFGSSTSLSFNLVVPADVSINVYDLRGARIRSVSRTGLAAGPHIFTWDGHNAAGTPAAAGVYFVSVQDGYEVARRRVVLMR